MFQKLQNDPFNQWMLRFLLDLLQTEKLVKSAENFGLSVPSASRALKKMRAHFADPLFVSNGSRLTPTPLMIGMEHRLRQAIESLERLTSPNAFDARTTRKSFRIASRGLITASFLCHIVQALLKEAPHARLEHHYRGLECYEDLLDDRLDFILSTDQHVPPALRCMPLFTLDWVVVARIGHPIFSRVPQSNSIAAARVAKFSRVAFQLGANPSSSLDWQALRDAANDEIVLRTHDAAVALPTLECTDLVMVVPRVGVLSMLHRYKLDYRAIKREPGGQKSPQAVLVWTEARHRDRASIWFRDLVRQAPFCSATHPL